VLRVRKVGLPSLQDYSIPEGAVQDPNNSALYMSGLSARTNPGQAVEVIFTVSAHHTALGWILAGIPSVDSFTGLVVDPKTNTVLLTMATLGVKLYYGGFTGVKITSSGVVPTSYAGQSLEIVVGPSNILAPFDSVGSPPPGSAGGILTTTVTVPEAPTGPPIPSPPGGPLSATTWALIAAGGVTALTGTAVAIHLHREREVYEP